MWIVFFNFEVILIVPRAYERRNVQIIFKLALHINIVFPLSSECDI